MKAQEFVAEIDKLQGRDFTVSKSVLDREYPYSKIADKTTPLPGGSGLVYHTRFTGTSTAEILVADPKKEAVVGFLELQRVKSFPIDEAYRVLSIGVDPAARGQGVAKSLYGIYLSIWKHPLIAGDEQTPGGRRNWLSLARIPGVEIKGYVTINDHWFDRIAKMPDYRKGTIASFDEFLDAIMKMGGEYIGEEQGIHYFAFDVAPGSGELKPVVKNALKVYYGEFDNKYEVFGKTGLYAVWKGK